LILSVKDNKLLVVNKLYLSDYLKWLWEVSDSDNPEKIKTIVVAARTYARWYMTKAIKFPWESYQGSDNPDEFQRYLWYSLEQRSPKINKIVNETADQIITYNNDIIKPWYFTQSAWKTLSYKDYCKDNLDCKKINYPYLSSVFDPGSVWKTKLGHWVGISWAWATFLASKWWTEDMIIKYFLKGVEIKKI
jgi:SpoIID/LytB domain protein